jgi:hypothetical protein
MTRRLGPTVELGDGPSRIDFAVSLQFHGINGINGVYTNCVYTTGKGAPSMAIQNAGHFGYFPGPAYALRAFVERKGLNTAYGG